MRNFALAEVTVQAFHVNSASLYQSGTPWLAMSTKASNWSACPCRPSIQSLLCPYILIKPAWHEAGALYTDYLSNRRQALTLQLLPWEHSRWGNLPPENDMTSNRSRCPLLLSRCCAVRSLELGGRIFRRGVHNPLLCAPLIAFLHLKLASCN